LTLAAAKGLAAEPARGKFTIQREITASYPAVVWGVEFGEAELNELRKDELAGLKKYAAGVPWLKSMTGDDFENSSLRGEVVSNLTTQRFVSRPEFDLGIAAYTPQKKSAAGVGLIGALIGQKSAVADTLPSYQAWVGIKDLRAVDVPSASKGELRAGRDFIGDYERFRMEKLPNERVALKFHTGYLTAVDGGGNGVIARKNLALEWEAWTLRKNDDGSISLLSPKGVPLRVLEAAPYKLVNQPAAAEANPAWVRFQLIAAREDVYALKTTRGTYLSAYPESRR
jgi:hypothetical protein